MQANCEVRSELTKNRCEQNLQKRIDDCLQNPEKCFRLPTDIERLYGQANHHGVSLGQHTNPGPLCNGTRIFPAVYDALIANTTIRSLDAWRMTKEHARWIIKILQKNPNITALTFEELETGALEIITNALMTITTVKEVTLDFHSSLEDEATLIALLSHHSHLTSVAIRHVGIPIRRGTTLANALMLNQTLTNLELHGYHFSSEGMHAFCEMIKHNQSLTSIDLNWSRCENETDLFFLAEAISLNTRLTHLGLHYFSPSNSDPVSEMDEKMAGLFMNAVKLNSCLLTVDLTFEDEIKNKFSSELSIILARNKAKLLKEMDVSALQQMGQFSRPSSGLENAAIAIVEANSNLNEAIKNKAAC